jgi:hypothetical protein
MSAEALPHSLLIVLVEFTVGGVIVTLLSQLRGQSAASFIKFCAATIFVMAALTFWVAAKIQINDEVDGYPLDPSYMPEARAALVLVFALSLPYAVLTIFEKRTPSLVAGAATSIAGVAAVAFLAQVFAIPTWGFALTFVSLLVGALVVGAVSIGMILGHWYLVTPRLPEAPLRELTGFLLIIMLVQALLIIPALALPRDSFESSVDTPILENAFFWLRIAGGIGFPLVLAYMAYDSSGVRAMQSATGLLYIAMALVLAGEVMGKGIFFVSAVPN